MGSISHPSVNLRKLLSPNLSAAGNPLPSDRTPQAPSPAGTVILKRYQELIADKTRRAALLSWIEDCHELQAAGDPKVGISLFFAEAEKAMQLNTLYGAHMLLENWPILSQEETGDVLLNSLAMASEAFSGHAETLQDASRAAYYAATAALDNLGDQEAAFLWAHRAIKLAKLASETYLWVGDCWILIGRTGPANGMADASGAWKTGLDLQTRIAANLPEANFNLALGWKHYADYLDNTSRQGEALIALGEATKIVSAIPAALRCYPEIVAIVAAYQSRLAAN